MHVYHKLPLVDGIHLRPIHRLACRVLPAQHETNIGLEGLLFDKYGSQQDDLVTTIALLWLIHVLSYEQPQSKHSSA